MDIQTAYQEVTAEIATAQSKIESLQAQWTHVCSNGLAGAAEVLEQEIEKERRSLQRLQVQQAHLATKCEDADRLVHAVHLAGLEAQVAADIEAVETIFKQVQPLTAQLALTCTSLTVAAEAVRESRIHAKQQGATVEGLASFATQERAALVTDVVDSLGQSRKALAHIAQYLARLSMM